MTNNYEEIHKLLERILTEGNGRQDIRKLLHKAFDTDELSILAHDHLPEIYEDIIKLTHNEKTQRITNYVFKKGRIHTVLEYVQEHNFVRYNEFLENQGERTLADKDLELAIKLFRLAGAEEKVQHVREVQELERLEEIAIGYEEEERWKKAEEIYRQLVARKPESQRWVDAVDRVEKEQLLNELYAKALKDKDKKHWEEVEDALIRIIHIRSTYRDAASLLAEVRQFIAIEKTEVTEPPPPLPHWATPLIVSVIIFPLLFIALSFIFPGFPPFVPPTTTPPPIVDLTATAEAAFANQTTIATQNISTPTSAVAIMTPGPTITPTPTGSAAVLERLQEQGLTIAVRGDAPPYSSVITDVTDVTDVDINGSNVADYLEGFDIGIARYLIETWEIDPEKVKFLLVSAEERITVLQEDQADITIGALSYTDERCKEDASCSQSYASDGARLLVRSDSEITNTCDLNGKVVGVLPGTTTQDLLQAGNLGACPDPVELAQIEPFADAEEQSGREQARNAVSDGEIAAYAADGRILEALAEDHEDLRVVGDEFSDEDYRIAVKKGEDGLIELINAALQIMKADGTYDELHKEKLGDRNKPFPIAIDSSTTSLPLNSCAASPDEDIPDTYRIQEGETLGRLALKYYGEFALYRCIARESGIADVYAIAVGEELDIPSCEECLQIMSTIE